LNTVRYQPSPIADISLIQAEYENHAFKPHYHLDYHIGLISHGQQVFNYKGSKHHIGPGFIQVMMPDQVHDSQTLIKQAFSTRIFSLSNDWFCRLVDENKSNQFLPLLQYCVHDKQLYQQLISLHELLSHQQSFQLAADSIALDLFSQLLHRYSDIKQPQDHVIGVRQLRELRDYLMVHLADKIYLSDLAKLCQLSESQLLRQFKRKTGITPYAWLARLRLEKALQLLKAGSVSTQVCYQVGFYDQAHFIKAFNRAYGLTPSQVFQ